LKKHWILGRDIDLERKRRCCRYRCGIRMHCRGWCVFVGTALCTHVSRPVDFYLKSGTSTT